MTGFENIAYTSYTHDVGKFMRIEHHNRNATRRDNTSELGENKHGAFDVHMPIDKSRGQPATLQIALFVPSIAITRNTRAYNETISNGDVDRVTLTATHINELSIA